MRTLIIGDIHGCDQAFAALLDKVQIDVASDTLVLLGDIMDRGPDSWEVYQRAAWLERMMGERFVLLRGNHEAYWMQKKPSIRQMLLHNRVGRGSTLRSFRSHTADTDEFIAWIGQHTSLFYRTDEFQCVHAGIRVETIETNDLETLIHDHGTVEENRYQGKLTVTGHLMLKEPIRYAGDGITTEKLTTGREYPMPRSGVICIDTGCCMGGALTAMVIERNNFTLFAV